MTAVRELPVQQSGLTIETVNVTPTMAEKWLGKNVRNRRVNQAKVSEWARAMTRGEWMLTGEAIKFGVGGELLDGQHRLLGVIESGKTVRMLVVRGLLPEAQDVMDTGRVRGAADQLYIHGHANSSNLAAAAKVAILWETGRFYVDAHRKAVSHKEVLDFAEGNTMLAFTVARSAAIKRGCDLRPAIVAMTFYELMKVDDQAALLFFDRLADGVNLPSGSPILALRARLRAIKDERTLLPAEALVGLVFRTWNAWRAGRKLAVLPLYKGGELIPCPEPK